MFEIQRLQLQLDIAAMPEGQARLIQQQAKQQLAATAAELGGAGAGAGRRANDDAVAAASAAVPAGGCAQGPGGEREADEDAWSDDGGEGDSYDDSFIDDGDAAQGHGDDEGEATSGRVPPPDPGAAHSALQGDDPAVGGVTAPSKQGQGHAAHGPGPGPDTLTGDDGHVVGLTTTQQLVNDDGDDDAGSDDGGANDGQEVPFGAPLSATLHPLSQQRLRSGDEAEVLVAAAATAGGAAPAVAAAAPCAFYSAWVGGGLRIAGSSDGGGEAVTVVGPAGMQLQVRVPEPGGA